MLENVITILGTLISTGGLVLVGWLTYRNTRKKDREQTAISEEANAITWSKELLERVRDLEGRERERDEEVKSIKKDLERLGKVFGVAVNYIERFLQWAKDGSRPPIPDIPNSLREHLDPSLIDEHHRQQRDHNQPEE